MACPNLNYGMLRIGTAQKLYDYLIEEKSRIEANKVDLAPSIRKRLDLIWDRLESDFIHTDLYG